MSQDVIKELREENKKLREILTEALGGPYKIGNIIVGPTNGSYRVSVNGTETIYPLSPKLNHIQQIPAKTEVLVNEKFITSIVHDKLHNIKPAVKFDRVKWDNIGGLRSQMSKIRDAVELPILHSDIYKKFKLSPFKGILLYGPPGCGKTLVAKAIASTIIGKEQVDENAFVYLKGAEMLSPYVGVTENKIQAMFENARKYYDKTGKRAVIFIDEAEALLPRRGSRNSSDVDATIVPTFLSEMDGFENNNTLIILATNFIQNLDDAIIRPGRIDLKIEIDRPTEQDSVEIFYIHLENTLLSEKAEQLSIEAAKLLHNSALKSNVSGALIARIVQEATMKAVKNSIATHSIRGVGFSEIKESINELS